MGSSVLIGVVGDFDESKPSHKATNEALRHCALYLSMNIEIRWLPTAGLEGNIVQDLNGFDAFWCAPGSPYLSYTGAINAIRFARENDYTFIGTCGGFQHAVMEYAQNVLGIAEVNHQEYNPDASDFFISTLSCPLIGTVKKIYLKSGSVTRHLYGDSAIEERYNCSFGLNVRFQDVFNRSGFKIAGVDENGEVRIFELPANRFYVATLFQPQLSSTAENPHKLIVEYLKSAKAYHDGKLINGAEPSQ